MPFGKELSHLIKEQIDRSVEYKTTSMNSTGIASRSGGDEGKIAQLETNLQKLGEKFTSYLSSQKNSKRNVVDYGLAVIALHELRLAVTAGRAIFIDLDEPVDVPYTYLQLSSAGTERQIRYVYIDSTGVVLESTTDPTNIGTCYIPLAMIDVWTGISEITQDKIKDIRPRVGAEESNSNTQNNLELSGNVTLYSPDTGNDSFVVSAANPAGLKVNITSGRALVSGEMLNAEGGLLDLTSHCKTIKEFIAFSDGTTKAFNLYHKSVSNVVVYANDVAVPVTVDAANGSITFAAAPSQDVKITASYTFSGDYMLIFLVERAQTNDGKPFGVISWKVGTNRTPSEPPELTTYQHAIAKVDMSSSIKAITSGIIDNSYEVRNLTQYDLQYGGKLDGSSLRVGAITGDKILAGSIDAAKIASGAIQAGHIATGAIIIGNLDSTTQNTINVSYSTANTALNNAVAAQTTANTAVANATAAQSTANTASSNATTALSQLTEISSDSKLTPMEKQSLKREWDSIVAEKPTIDAQATVYNITTEKTNYGASYATLNAYVAPLLAVLTTTSDIVGTTLCSNFADYYSKKAALLKKVSDSSKSIGDAAQAAASTAQGTANNAVSNAAAAQTTANSAATLANAAQGTANTAQSAANNANYYTQQWTYPNTTYINGGKIFTNSITADQLDSTVLNLTSNGKTLNAGGVTLDNTGMKITETSGAYTKFDSDGIKWYKNNIPYAAVRRMVQGSARNGQYVRLNWDKNPFILLGPRSIQTTVPGYDNTSLRFIVEPYEVSSAGFRVRAVTAILSGNGHIAYDGIGTANMLGSFDSHGRPAGDGVAILSKIVSTSINTTSLYITYSLHLGYSYEEQISSSAYSNRLASGSCTLKIEYKASSSNTWITFLQQNYSGTNTYPCYDYTIGVNLIPNVYDLRISMLNANSSRVSGTISFSGGGVIINDNEVSFLAMESDGNSYFSIE